MNLLLLVLAVLLQLAAGVLYAGVGLVAPLWAVLALWASWLALLGLLLHLWRRRAALALLVPPAALGLVLGAVSAGEAALGWTA